jgi:hypothetical protein
MIKTLRLSMVLLLTHCLFGCYYFNGPDDTIYRGYTRAYPYPYERRSTRFYPTTDYNYYYYQSSYYTDETPHSHVPHY